MVKKSSLIDGLIYLFIGILTGSLILSFNYNSTDPLVIFSFIINGIYFFCGIVFCKKNISLRRLFYIFNYVFMFIAPMNQYCSGTVFWKSQGLRITYSDSDYMIANGLVILFCILFDIAYNYKKTAKAVRTGTTKELLISYNSVLLLDLLSIAVFMVLLLSDNIFSSRSFDTTNQNLGSQFVKIMKGFPIAVIAYQIIFWEQNVRHKKMLIAIPAIEILVIYFPFLGTTSRFLLFGAYLTIISLLFAGAKYKAFYPMIFVIGFGFVFSAFNFFKSHGWADLGSFSLGTVSFNHVDYDAYQLLMATVYYVRHYGVCWGINILSAILGFVPRSIWHGKALPSGQIVIGTLGSWFTNVSCPWIAEWYYAFGTFGIIIGAIISGALVKWIDSFANGINSPLLRGIYAVLTGFSIYILRGALLPTWNYTFVVILDFVAVDYLMSQFNRRGKN